MIIITDRTVKVSLILQAQGYMQGMGEVSKQTSETGSKIEKLAQQRESFNTLGVAALGFGAALGAGVAFAVSKFAEFDQQMSYVEAATHETAANMDLLRDAALDAGASTVFSATEAAQAIEELSKAGLSTSDILSGALAGSMDLAAAGGLSVARAAEITSTALNQFELDGSQASHVSDLLAAGAGKAMGSVDDLAQGLKFVGPVANAMGVSLEETTGVIALFAQQGIIGEQAGTSLRGVLASLTSPSAQARKEIERLGITLYDSEGNFMGLQNAAGELSQAYTTMDGASRDASLGIIFGRETVTAATALYKAGADGVQEWTAAVDDSGYASETAAMRLDNLAGDWEALTGALDTAFITMGEGANGPLRFFVEQLTGLVDNFNTLPDWAQQSTLSIAALAAGIALAAGGFLLAVPKIAEFNSAIAVMGPGAQRAARFTTALGKAAGAAALLYGLAAGAAAAAGAMGLMGESAKSAEKTTKLLLDADFDGVFAGLTTGTSSVHDLQSALDSLLASDPGTAFNRWGSDTFAFTGLESSVGKAREQFAIMGESLAKLVNSGDGDRAKRTFDEIAAAAAEYGYSSEQVTDLMPAYTDALAGVDNANTLASESTTSAADALLDQAGAAGELQSQLSDLISMIDEANGRNRDAVTANIDYQETLRSVDEQIANIRNGVEGFAAGLDITTAAGAANKEMLVGLSQDAWDAAAAQLQLDGDTAAFTSTLEAQRQKLYDAAKAMGASDEEAGYLRDTLLAMPPDRTIRVLADTSSANANLNSLLGRLNEAVRTHFNIPVSTVGVGTVLKPPGSAAGDFFSHSPTGFAAGGFPSGIYSGTAGSIHKFAEPWLPWESYISGDPGRRDRNVGIWEKTGEKLGVWQQGGLAAPAPVIQVGAAPTQVSLAGAELTLLVDGRPMRGIIQEQIVNYDAGLAATVHKGRRQV